MWRGDRLSDKKEEEKKCLRRARRNIYWHELAGVFFLSSLVSVSQRDTRLSSGCFISATRRSCSPLVDTQRLPLSISSEIKAGICKQQTPRRETTLIERWRRQERGREAGLEGSLIRVRVTRLLCLPYSLSSFQPPCFCSSEGEDEDSCR